MTTPHRPGTAPISATIDFFSGVSDIWRGMGFLMRRPTLWAWAIIPFILNIALFVLISWCAWHFLGGWIHQQAASGFWIKLFGWLLGLIFWLAVGLATIFCFVPLATLIASPFNDILSEKVEKIYAGATVGAGFSLRATLRIICVGLSSSLRLMLITLGLLACTLPLHLIPGLGSVLATAASVAITIWFLSLQFTAYSMDRRFYTYHQRKDFLRRHRARTIGLGAMAFVIMLIPVANALFISISAVAGTLLFCDTQLSEAAPSAVRR